MKGTHTSTPVADGLPAQIYSAAITKFTDVPESDVLLAVWKAEPFWPVHYLAIDRKAGKIVISVRHVS